MARKTPKKTLNGKNDLKKIAPKNPQNTINAFLSDITHSSILALKDFSKKIQEKMKKL
jgi:hypothetical protein